MKKFFPFALAITTPWNFKKCSKNKIHLRKLRVKSNFTNVNSHIPLFNFISNYVDGQKRIIQSLKPPWKFSPVKKCMLKVNNKNAKEICLRLTIKTPERRHWLRSGVFIVKFEYISHTFPCVSNDDFKHAFVSWERYNEIIILGSFYSQYKMPVNFIKLLCWNMITQLKESVSWFYLNTGK